MLSLKAVGARLNVCLKLGRWIRRRNDRSGVAAVAKLPGGSRPVAAINYRPHDATLIDQAGWQSFPDMPDGFGFYAYSQPVGDPREWFAQVQDIEWFDALEYGQAEVVRSWEAWGNSSDEYLVVWFEIDERLELRLHAPLNVDAVNEALTGKIEICARYGPSGIWVDPRIASLD